MTDSPSDPAALTTMWGPLAHLIGEWEGTGGVDSSFSHGQGAVIETPYRERVTMKPFGPVANGRQELYGLDYKTAMFREGEEFPFHTELGYWLYDPATGEILKAFVVPRGISVLAGAITSADATTFTMKAAVGDPKYGIAENAYLREMGSSVSHDITVVANADGTWSYDETTMLKMGHMPDLLPHTDRNTLTRID